MPDSFFARSTAGAWREVTRGSAHPVEHAHVARQAFLDFCEARHAAGQNFGDCFSYALAKVTGEPLLFNWDDFNNTDILTAL